MPRDDKPAHRTPTPVPEAMEPDAAAAYQQLLPEAKALPADSILPYRLDPDLIVANVRRALRVVTAHRNDIPKHMPKIDLAALESIGKLALAVKYSALEADRTVPSERVISQKLTEARQHRATLMPIVAGLVATGYVSQTRYDDLARGQGPRDVAEDCVALAQVFREGGRALDGKHSADPGTIAKAAALGSWLLDNLRSAHVPAEKPPQPAVDIRNRFATLLTRRYAMLQTVAHYFYGDSYEEVAPPLMSRQIIRSRRETTLTSPGLPTTVRTYPIAAAPA